MNGVLATVASAPGVVALFLIGFGVIFQYADGASRTSRALALRGAAVPLRGFARGDQDLHVRT